MMKTKSYICHERNVDSKVIYLLAGLKRSNIYNIGFVKTNATLASTQTTIFVVLSVE